MVCSNLAVRFSVKAEILRVIFIAKMFQEKRIRKFREKLKSQAGMWKRWKWSFFCGSGSTKNLPLALPHRLFDLKSLLAKKFCPFPNVAKQ